MTDIIIILILAAVFVPAAIGASKRLRGGCCGGSKTVKIKPRDKNISHYKYGTRVYIDGMTCKHCKLRVENAFNSSGGCYARVNLKKKYAEVFSNELLSEEELNLIITKNGYTLKDVVNLAIK